VHLARDGEAFSTTRDQLAHDKGHPVVSFFVAGVVSRKHQNSELILCRVEVVQQRACELEQELNALSDEHELTLQDTRALAAKLASTVSVRRCMARCELELTCAGRLSRRSKSRRCHMSALRSSN
jgi:hypothetical protein